MTVNFNKHGAKIESIYYDDLKIAENGFIAGRCANRVANASFQLDGVTYSLNKNEGNNHLHGGSKGFGEIDWTLADQTYNSITFTLHSKDKDMGYPGNMDVTTKYTLDDEGALSINVTAISDKKTIFNPTNHLYMSLNGDYSSKKHKLQILADTYTEVGTNLIPTGNLPSVEGKKWDYRQLKTYVPGDKNDVNLCTNDYEEGVVKKVAELQGTTSGIKVEVSSDRPGLQLYNTDNSICLEAQHYPDAIHHQDDENWPTVVLDANVEYSTTIVYKFSR